MQSFMVSLLGLVLGVSVGAEPLLKGRVWLASGPPAAGVQVRLFDLTDLRRSVGTTTDEAGYFALRLASVGGPALPDGFALGQNYPNPSILPPSFPTSYQPLPRAFGGVQPCSGSGCDGWCVGGDPNRPWVHTALGCYGCGGRGGIGRGRVNNIYRTHWRRGHT